MLIIPIQDADITMENLSIVTRSMQTKHSMGSVCLAVWNNRCRQSVTRRYFLNYKKPWIRYRNKLFVSVD